MDTGIKHFHVKKSPGDVPKKKKSADLVSTCSSGKVIYISTTMIIFYTPVNLNFDNPKQAPAY